MIRKCARNLNKLFCLCILGTMVLAAGVILLPRHLGRTLDEQEIGKVHLASRDGFSFMEVSHGETFETIQAFEKILDSESELTLLGSFDSEEQMNDAVLKEVYNQVEEADSFGLIPWLHPRSWVTSTDWFRRFSLRLSEDGKEEIVGYSSKELGSLFLEDWQNCLVMAEYYCLTYAPPQESRSKSESKEMMNFWHLRFSDQKSFDYYFIVDAVNFKIYYAEIYNVFTDTLMNAYEYMDTNLQEIEKKIEDMQTDSAAVSVDGKQTASAVISVDETTEQINECFYSINLWLADGCMAYYEPVNAEVIDRWSDSNVNLHDKIMIMILSYENGNAYVEERALEEKELPLRGFSVGFQNLGTKF